MLPASVEPGLNTHLCAIIVTSGLLSRILTCTVLSWHWHLYCFSLFLILFLFLATCARLRWPHSAFESTLNASVVLYPSLLLSWSCNMSLVDGWCNGSLIQLFHCHVTEKSRELGGEQWRSATSTFVPRVGIGEGRLAATQLVLTRRRRDHLSAY